MSSELNELKTFQAVVFSGLGEGEFFVNLYARNIRSALGITPYPGTLNLRLVGDPGEYLRALVRLRPTVIEPPAIPGARLGRVYAYPALLDSAVPVFIVRPEITTYKPDVIEVVAEARLRDLLNLNDGSVVSVSIEDP